MRILPRLLDNRVPDALNSKDASLIYAHYILALIPRPAGYSLAALLHGLGWQHPHNAE
jgi:hypothetical protein